MKPEGTAIPHQGQGLWGTLTLPAPSQAAGLGDWDGITDVSAIGSVALAHGSPGK